MRTKTSITKSIVIIACLCGFNTISAQFSQTAKVVSANRESRAEYGTSVAIVEDFAIVGTSREIVASGAAYIYNKDSQGIWSYSQRLAANDPNDGAEFGGGVKFANDYVVVAAGRADIGSAQRAGALYVYDYQNNTWEFNTKLTASDLTSEAKLGMNPTSLDVEGNTIVAGAPGENGWMGSVYVFTETAGTWSETQKILSPNPQENDVFGIGVSISGDYLVVGANEVDGRKGAAYVYSKNSNGTWEYAQTLMASDAANNDFFGTSVNIAGDQMVIGAYGANAEAGAAYIFEKDSQGVWAEVQKLTANTSSEGTQFGWSTDIQQNYIIVSAPHIYSLEAGEVYFYKRDGSGTWTEEQIIQGSDTAGEDFYGWSIAMYKNQLIAGAPWEDEDSTGGNTMDRAGSAYIFQDLTMGVNDLQATASVLVYPIPTKKTLTISSRNGLGEITLLNQLGSVLLQSNAKDTLEHTLDLSQYAKGIYFLRIGLGNGQTEVKKIILE